MRERERERERERGRENIIYDVTLCIINVRVHMHVSNVMCKRE